MPFTCQPCLDGDHSEHLSYIDNSKDIWLCICEVCEPERYEELYPRKDWE